jgi:hypothetical protein
MESLTTLRRDETLVLSVDQRKQKARECWDVLPGVIKDIFTNAPKVAMYEALRRMGVDAQPSRSVEWAYATSKNSLVVTVWHDQIRAALGPDLLYYIPTGTWGKIAGLAGRAEQMGKELRRFSGQQVNALLLQHEWDRKGTPTAKRVAPDVKRWFVEQVKEDEFILWRGRRSTTS